MDSRIIIALIALIIIIVVAIFMSRPKKQYIARDGTLFDDKKSWVAYEENQRNTPIPRKDPLTTDAY
jgi:hypothetical protein